MAKKEKCVCKAVPEWLNTYGDMVTLLLTFFVLLFSMSSISPGKFQQVVVGLTLALSGNPPSVLTGGQTMSEEALISTKPGVYQELLRVSEEYKGKVTIEERDEGTLITLTNFKIFETGSARLTAEAKEIIEKLGAMILEHTSNIIEVRGYADDRPTTPDSIYPSNWHLSCARAASVVNFMLTELKQKRYALRYSEIRSGLFDIDYFYSPDRFVPIGKGDVDVNRELKSIKANYDYDISKLQSDYESGKISYEEYQKKRAELTKNYNIDVEKTRAKYRKIEIVIKRETKGY
ncbi:chemotaxis protein MotB [Fervidobacterium changbaicum]|uniref:Flagellar motor protein MotB n=1 Tax=Fervidobacterium changbaicum TaxID=310769 RepID=A0ABX5QU42_9BACT|nr:flagellar motor protein MotB [Fervidobacterium changbaicum]QAV33690.1 flagellar motor protein MotB [Fervidobacterium changbaicum]SDH40149.1 chemotaxis protein MotB [Fervidobacterium changbaicum]